MVEKYNKSLFIFHRDFRLDDNISLFEAIKKSKKVMPIFIFTKQQVINNEYKSERSIQFMIECLFELNEELKKRNSELFIFLDKSNDYKIINEICKNEEIECIFTNYDYSPFSIKREKIYENIAKQNGINIEFYHDYNLFKPNDILTNNGKNYEKFTPFYNKCLENKELINKPSKYNIKSNDLIYKNILSNKTKKHLKSLEEFYFTNEIINLRENNLLIGGITNGKKILNNIEKWKNYDNMRNYLTYETTQLSAYMKYGCISVREVYDIMKTKLGINHPLLRQVFWREFYSQLLYSHPNLLDGKSLKPKYDKIKWNENEVWFNAWKNGMTGIPIVDACMRQLNNSGYMHNRGRLIVAECLVKLMGIDWRKGEKYFATKLIDYDPASNNGNWQWVAGSGADSQPYFRIMNIWTQGEKYDPDAKYIKKWLPFFEKFDPKYIHKWYETSQNIELLLELYQFDIDKCYTCPIFDYKTQREKALAMYKKIF